MADHVLKVPENIKYTNFEQHAFILKQHADQLKQHETAFDNVRVDAGKAKSEAVHAVEIAKETADSCRRDIGIIEKDIEYLKDKISGLATESAVNILTDSIVAEREARELVRKHDESKRTRTTSIIVALIGFAGVLGAVWFKGEVDKTNTMFLNSIESTLTEIEATGK